jgi:integrase
MSMGVYEKNNKAWIDFRFHGVRCRESLRIPFTKANEKFAQRRLGEIENKIATGTFVYSDYFPDSPKCKLFGCRTSSNTTFKELYEQWIDVASKRLQAEIITQSTYNNYVNDCRNFLELYQGHNIRSITKADVEDYIIEEAITKKAKTINNALTTLGQIFSYAVDKEMLDSNPIKKAKRLKVKKPDIYPFSKDEMFKVLEHLYGSNAFPIIATMFFTGMRTGEALAMKWENLDTKNWTYHIKESFSKRKLSKPKTPGSVRVITLSEPVKRLLKEQKAVSFLRSEYIFINRFGRPYTSSKNIVEHFWQPALEELEIEYRIPYQCRHTFAILSLKAGDDPELVAKQLGHTSLDMLFSRYARYLKNTERTESKFAQMVTIWSPKENTNLKDIVNKD